MTLSMTLEEAVQQLLDRWHDCYSPKWIDDLEMALRQLEKVFYASKAKPS